MPRVRRMDTASTEIPSAWEISAGVSVVDVAPHEHVARVLGQRGERTVEQPDQLGAVEVRLELDVLGGRCGLLVEPRDRGEVAAAPAAPAQADVAGDRGEPALAARRVVELVRVPPGLEQRLLREVLRGLAVARDRAAQRDEPASSGRRPEIDPGVHGSILHDSLSPAVRRDQRRYSYWSARRTFRRDARRAGNAAATSPARMATTTSTAKVTYGMAKTIP